MADQAVAGRKSFVVERGIEQIARKIRTERPADMDMSWADCDEIYWADFYHRSEAAEPSPFCLDLIARTDFPELVFDLGCGDGRDSVGFAAAGRRVVGVDRSAAAVRRARELAGDRAVTFVQCDLLDTAALAAECERARAGDELALTLTRLTTFPFPSTALSTIKGDFAGMYGIFDLDIDFFNRVLGLTDYAGSEPVEKPSTRPTKEPLPDLPAILEPLTGGLEDLLDGLLGGGR